MKLRSLYDRPDPVETVRDASWLNLTDGEDVVFATNPSIWPVVPELLMGLIVIVGSVAGAIMYRWEVVFGVLLGLGLLGYFELARRRTWYVLTDEEVYIKSGIISTRKRHTRHERLQDTSYDVSIVERLLGFGDIHLTTSGTNAQEFLLQNVPNPSEFSQLITELIDAAVGGESPRE
jgi:membrane protein YdbS with pleckstrin-like domain